MLSFKIILGFLFGLLVISILGVAIVAYQNNKITLEAAELVRHTHQVLEQADEIASLSKDVQLESSLFFISSDSAVLEPYRVARRKILPLIEELQLFTNDNSEQRLRVDTLSVKLKKMISLADEVLEGNKRNYNTAQLKQRFLSNYHYRKEIREIIELIKEQQEELLIVRERNHVASIAAFNKAFFLLMSGIAVLMATTFFSIRYNFNKRVRAEEQQRKATELFSKLFYESPMGIVISRLETGEIIDCNIAYQEMVNYSKTELIGKTAVALGILNSVNQRNEIVNQVRKNGVSRDLEIQLRPKNGDQIWVSKSMQLIRIDHEDCIMSALLDMTVHKEAEERIRLALQSEIELNKLKSNFVTLASHEFRTPLTTILSSASLLEKYAMGEHKEKIIKHISRIKASLSLLTSILDEFLSLTKIEEGKVQPKIERINVTDIMNELCSGLKSFTRPGQHLTYSHTGEEEFSSDPVLLGNIVNNLVSNAIKYSPEEAEICISTCVNSKFHLSVRDHGIGISKKDQEHLFERFFRASNTGNIQGTGLGLHLMKHYVDMLEGTIAVESDPGKGSEFTVTFDRR